MQRIDENTYIDDTLVTCAEYQLFIDEMREQGKYYQPDHWTSYQFPEGQAREPILGVRHSDATAFCEWLTRRDDRAERKYRLPTQEEAANYSMKSLAINPLGYWFGTIVYRFGSNKFKWKESSTHFTWIGPIPNDARGIALNSTQAISIVRSRVPFVARFQAPAPVRKSAAFILTRLQDRVYKNIEHSYSKTLESERDRIRRRDQFIAHTLDVTLNNSRTCALDLTLVDIQTMRATFHPLKKTLHLARRLPHGKDIVTILSKNLHLIYTRILDYDIELSLNTILDFLIAAHPDIRSRDLALIFNLYIDIFTLQERIAGRSPAFEGIRLVKERIR